MIFLFHYYTVENNITDLSDFDCYRLLNLGFITDLPNDVILRGLLSLCPQAQLLCACKDKTLSQKSER